MWRLKSLRTVWCGRVGYVKLTDLNSTEPVRLWYGILWPPETAIVGFSRRYWQDTHTHVDLFTPLILDITWKEIINLLTPTVAIWAQLYSSQTGLSRYFWHPGTLTLRTERQSARMSKITDDSLTRYGTWCFIAVPIWQQWASKG